MARVGIVIEQLDFAVRIYFRLYFVVRLVLTVQRENTDNVFGLLVCYFFFQPSSGV